MAISGSAAQNVLIRPLNRLRIFSGYTMGSRPLEAAPLALP